MTPPNIGEHDDTKRDLVGSKTFAYDVTTREKRYANEAKKHTPYRLPEGYCHRVDDDGGTYFRFYTNSWHADKGYPERPNGSARLESSAHDEAVEWIAANRRVGAAFEDGHLYIRFSRVVMEFWTGARRPDIRGVVEICYPPIFLVDQVVFIEICLSCAVDDPRKMDLLNEGVATIEIALDQGLLASRKGDQEAEIRKQVRTDLVGCPSAKWIVGADCKSALNDRTMMQYLIRSEADT